MHHLEKSREGLLDEISRLEAMEKECQEAKRELEESRQQLEAILNESPALISISHKRDGMVLETNWACEPMLAFSRDELLGKSAVELGIYSMLDRQRLLSEIDKKGAARNLPLRMKRKDGIFIETEASSVPFKYRGEECLLTVTNDVTGRNMALEALRLSDERLQEALLNSRHVLYRRNVKTDHYDYMSPSIEELTGYPLDFYLKNGLNDLMGLVHPDDRQRIHTQVDEAAHLRQGTCVSLNLEYRLKKASGDYLWLNDWATLCFDLSGRMVSQVGSIYDISDRKKMEIELMEREDQLRSIFETSHAGIMLVDRQGIITFANRRMEELFGCPRSAFIGSPYPDHLHPENRKVCLSLMHQLISGDIDHVAMEKQYLRCNGDAFWGELSCKRLAKEDGTLRSLLLFITDITARKKVEEALRESEERYRTLVELSPDAIYILIADKFAFANDKGLRLLGVEHLEELHGKPVIEFIHADYHETLERCINVKDKDTGSGCMFELIIVNGGGTGIPVEVSSSPFIYGGEEAVQCIARDISERKRMQEELLKVQKLESLGVLAGGIAHDFNNILTGILGNLSFARMQIDPAHPVTESLKECESAAMQAGELTKQFLTFARGGEPVKTLIDPAPLIRKAASFSLSGSNFKSFLALADNLWCLEADGGQLCQVLHNLLLNAAQAVPGGGTVTVRAGNKTLEAGNPQRLAPGAYLVIAIEDQGCGIPAQNMGKVFDPYFTTKAGGSGLGLSSVYSIVARHKGRVEVFSKEGEGSRFTVYLPASMERVSQVEEVRVESDLSGKGRILLMDDEVYIREIVTKMLEFKGYKVESCPDGRDAVELFRTAHDENSPFAAVILDLTVPGGMGGKSAAPLIREIDPQAVLIVSSGYSDDPVIANYRDYGFSGAIPKPFNADTLAGELKRKLIEKN